MRAVIQRVTMGSVIVNGSIVGQIDTGLVVFAGIEDADNQEDIDWLSNKIVNLRIFNDEKDVMNLNVKEIDGSILLVSQFTLHAGIKKGNRPLVIKKINALIEQALQKKRSRIATKPSKAAKEKRISGKKLKSDIKEARKKMRPGAF